MARYVTLQQLCEEGFAASPSAMWADALDRGLPVGIDGGGLVGVRVSVADKLRQERAEQQAREARERELRRIEAQDAAVAELVRAAKLEETRARIARIERQVGPYGAVEQALQREMQSGYVSVDEHAALSQRVPTIDEVEEFAAREYGLDLAA